MAVEKGGTKDNMGYGHTASYTSKRSHKVKHLQAIWEELQEAVHAVDSMTTKTPDEAGQA